MYDDLIASMSQSMKRKAEKCVVRECDETEKGTFIAYVDEGEETYDVSLTFKKDILLASSCDCRKAKICEHKAALLIYISRPTTKSKSAVKVKKQDPLLALLNETDATVLKEWFGELMLNNKDIRLAFELQFLQSATLTIADIIEKTKNAVKTVVKNKKNVDVNQLKKIIDLWLKIHEPIVREYYEAVFNKDAFERFHSAMNTCAIEQERITTLSNKISVYFSEAVTGALENIHQLQQEDQWQQAVSLIFDGMKHSTHNLKMAYLDLLVNVYQVSNEHRQQQLIRQLMGRLGEIQSIHPYYKKEVGEFYLRMIKDNGLIEHYHESFHSIDYAYTYNTMLVEALIDLKEYARAEKICINEIKFHTKNSERPAYYRELIRIYTALGDDKKLLETMQRVFPYTFDFDDFILVHNTLKTGGERSAWRSTAVKMVQTPAKQLYLQAMDFLVRLALHEKNINQALHFVDNACPYTIILKHNAALIDMFKESFLAAILNRYDDHYYIANNKQLEAEMNAVDELVKLILQQYDNQLVKEMLMSVKARRKILKAEFALRLEIALT
ncbi:MAG TPA: hypothetical protein VLC28_08490 [Flavitalea sp.]|nr:hypothetical protein [Flavitalea sp.]